MLELKDGFVLYHGSYCEVKEPDLAKCAKRKDFGQGFYLTTSKEQAESFLRTSIAKAIATGTIEEGQKFGYISTFEFKLSENLETHIFENADVDWLHCIAAHRKKKMFIEVEREMAKYDIIAGKIDHRLEQLRDAVSSELDQIKMVCTPKCRIAWMKDSLKPESYLDLETAIRRLQKGQKEPLAFLGKVGVGISEEKLKKDDFQNYDLVFLRLDEEDIYEGKTEIFPEQKCVSIRFCGGHNAAPQYYRKLLKYIREQRLKIDGFSREITLIDYGMTNDTDKFVTEIRIPVE